MGEVTDRTAFTFDLYRNGLRGFRANGKTFLDFGCGALRPLEISTVFWLNGAARCIAVDQKPALNPEASEESLSALMDACHADPKRWLLPGSSETLFRERVAAGLNNARIKHVIGDVEATITAKGSVDAIVSSTVLEHVAKSRIRRLFRHFRFVLSSRGVMYHNVDYTDHGIHADPTLNYWSFMTDGHAIPEIEAGGDINKLRDSAMNQLFRDCGFRIEVDPLFCLSPPAHVLSALTREYRDISQRDLEWISTGVYAKPRMMMFARHEAYAQTSPRMPA
jgi:hypothetical protein